MKTGDKSQIGVCMVNGKNGQKALVRPDFKVKNQIPNNKNAVRCCNRFAQQEQFALFELDC